MGTAFPPKAGASRSIHSANLQHLPGPVDVTIAGLGALSNGVRRVPGEMLPWKLGANG